MKSEAYRTVQTKYGPATLKVYICNGCGKESLGVVGWIHTELMAGFDCLHTQEKDHRTGAFCSEGCLVSYFQGLGESTCDYCWKEGHCPTCEFWIPCNEVEVRGRCKGNAAGAYPKQRYLLAKREGGNGD